MVCAKQEKEYCAVKLPAVKSTNKKSYEFQKEGLLGCKVWNNGCNDCEVKYGKIQSCGKKSCLTPGTPSCKTKLADKDGVPGVKHDFFPQL